MCKSTALLIGLLLIALFGGATYILPDRAAILGTVLTAIVTLTGGYIGFQVVNNGVKGHNWNQQMYDSENEQEGGKK